MSLTLRYAARSDRGLIREGNEDSVYAGPRLLAVADGMGGMAAGEVASNIVVAALAPLDEDVSGSDLIDALKDSISAANQQLRDAVEANPALEGMGTTLTAMLFGGARIGLVHVGDSRAYVLRDGELTQITRDDTYVQMLVDEGRITPDEATTHPQRSLLTRALDGRDIDPEFSVREARVGDRYLLCSDGLSGVVSPETMAEALSLAEPREAADRLIALALRGGGPDNITCIVADIVDAEKGDDAPVVGGAAARDRGRASSASADSAAGRAALARNTGEVEPDEDDDDPEPPPHRVRTAVLALLALALVAGTGYLGWQYTQSQYYVGKTEDGYVAVFRGVRGSIGGVHLSDVAQRSELRMNELQPVVRRQVLQGIPAESRTDANHIVRRLQDQRRECTPAASPTPSAAASPRAKATPSVRVTSTPRPSPTAVSSTAAPTPTPSAAATPDCVPR
ncbi:MAG TPA: PP2C family serine/threonine-protein phosphatase [Mycobacteriales bacterium]|jgi:protein phosphatase|nr:protein phosphatase 2C-like protein [Cryptosporangiaceae bacterium]MDQ1678108.1 family protein phosphatase [Actinomycetota bacterium]HEV7755643.1 PP2C family serine/threonine-protein phosphatase [Mycobacteriales bacterium]